MYKIEIYITITAQRREEGMNMWEQSLYTIDIKLALIQTIML